MDKVVYAGEPVVVVIAEDAPSAQRAADLVEVAYDELEPLMTPEAALRPDAPLIHEEPYELGHAPGHVNLDGRKAGTNRLTHDVVAWGDIDAAFAKAATTIEGEYYYPMAFTYAMEPYVSIADYRGDEVTIWTSGQHTYTTRRDVADIFDLPLSRVRVVTPFVGGGFGSKSYSKVEPLAAVCSWRVRPAGEGRADRRRDRPDDAGPRCPGVAEDRGRRIRKAARAAGAGAHEQRRVRAERDARVGNATRSRI